MITLQTFMVILSGILLGPKAGALSQTVYIFLGIIGLPVFSGFTGGPQSVLKPSFGFLIGFIFASYAVGKIIYTKSKNNKGLSFLKVLAAAVSGNIIIYIFGLPYMYFVLNNVMNMPFGAAAVFKIGCLVFLPGDLLKIILASLLGAKLLPVMKKMNIPGEV
jgi:biotin transport system substrate-specific component